MHLPTHTHAYAAAPYLFKTFITLYLKIYCQKKTFNQLFSIFAAAKMQYIFLRQMANKDYFSY